MDLSPQPETWRVLVIEDERDNLDLVMTYLEYRGATVEGAFNGQIGLGMIDTFKPNLILLDLSMPVLDGWQLQRILRARPSLATVPIIAVTALVMPSDIERIRSANFDGYIAKPYRLADLLPQIAACIEQFLQRAAPIEPQTSASADGEEVRS